MKLKISAALQDELFRLAREAAPLECCGLVAGAGDEALSLRPLRNLTSRPGLFYVHPADEYRLLQSIWADGEGAMGTYHSHPDGDGRPSGVDRTLLAKRYRFHVIVGLRPAELRAWHVPDFDEAKVVT